MKNKLVLKGKLFISLGVRDIPEFMKSKPNHIESNQQNTKDIVGYYYEGNDGRQMNILLLSLVSIQQLSMERKLY